MVYKWYTQPNNFSMYNAGYKARQQTRFEEIFKLDF